MTYLDTIWTSLIIIGNVLIAVALVMAAAYIVYRCFPKRMRRKAEKLVRKWGEE